MSGVSKLNPRTTEYEWCGPIGAAFMVTTIPLTILIFNALCSPTSCQLNFDSVYDIVPATTNAIMASLADLPTALTIYGAWLAFHAGLYLLPLGTKRWGQPLRNGRRLQYNINAREAMLISYIVVFGAQTLGLINLADLADLSFPLAMAGILIGFVQAIALYVASFRSGEVLLALGGNTGNAIYDFWVGRELNPRIGALDLKFMCELRPGLIGWTLLSWAYVFKAFQSGPMSSGIGLIAAFQTWYVFEGLFFEAGNLTMMDIVHDGFGLMLSAGDLAWVPFLYTLQCRYLCYNVVPLPDWYLLLCICLHIGGYLLFRISNSTKDQFRQDPNHPKARNLVLMTTSAGKSSLSVVAAGASAVTRTTLATG
jgi:delta14-sterol reductase